MKLSRLKYLVCALLVGSLAIGIVATNVMAKDKAKLEAKAKVSQADAEKTALEKVPGGKIKNSELEEEDDVLIWSFDIAVEGSKDLTEVEVDAITGKVISGKDEKSEDEEKESANEKEDDDDKDEKE